MSKVLYEKRDRIAYVTINRPEARNAIDPDVHRLMIETWADFRDDDSVDVAILTGSGEAFCAGADLKTYIPPIMADATPHDIREVVELGLNGFTRGMHRISEADHRGGQRLGARGRARDGDGMRYPDRLRARHVRLLRGAARLPSRRRRAGPPGQHLRRRRRARRCCSRRSRSTPSRRCSGTWSRKVVPHDDLMDEAEMVARQILRNSQAAVRSAKQTILDVIGQPLDFQLRTEAWNAYTLRRPRGDHGAARPLLREDRRRTRRQARDRAVSRRALVTGAARGIGAAIAERLRVRRLRGRRGGPRRGLRAALRRGPRRAPRPDRLRRLRLERRHHRHDRPGAPDDAPSSGRATSTSTSRAPSGWSRHASAGCGSAATGGSSSSPAVRRSRAFPGQAAYAASKAGLLGMVKTIAAENVRAGDHRQRGPAGHGRDREGARRCRPRSASG